VPELRDPCPGVGFSGMHSGGGDRFAVLPPLPFPDRMTLDKEMKQEIMDQGHKLMNISISRDGVEIGQWTEQEVQTLLDEGKLLPTDYYWAQGMIEWQEIEPSIKPPPPAPMAGSKENEPPKKGINRLTFVGLWLTWLFISSGLLSVYTQGLLAGIILLTSITVLIYITILRLDNIGYKPYYMLLFLIPFVNAYMFLLCLLQAPNSVNKQIFMPTAYYLWFLIILILSGIGAALYLDFK